MFCIGAFRPQYSTANNQGNFVKFSFFPTISILILNLY